MKTVLFIVLKVSEVVAAFAIVGVLLYCIGFYQFIDWLMNYSMLLFWILDIGLLSYCTYSLIASGSFREWFELNRKWVNQIFNSNN